VGSAHHETISGGFYGGGGTADWLKIKTYATCWGPDPPSPCDWYWPLPFTVASIISMCQWFQCIKQS